MALEVEGAATGGKVSRMLFPMASVKSVSAHGPMVVDSADGVRFTADGKQYLDAFCGLMNVNVGYGRTELVDAAAETMKRLSFASNFFERTSNEALGLADRLAEITPEGIVRFIYSVGGSDAMDTAIKLIRHSNILAGKPEKMLIIARRGGYHGMTFGGATATGQDLLRNAIGPLLPDVIHVDQPEESKPGSFYADQLEAAILDAGPDKVAAFVAEPISLPPGVGIPNDDYWPAIQEVCRRHDVRLIIDEVVTGFGRTGRMFACEHWDIKPDVMTMSKGLTSGYCPLGAVGVSEEIYELLAQSDTILPHGFTAGGTPVACAIALANIDLIESEGLVAKSAEGGEHLLAGLRRLKEDYPAVTAVRAKGQLAAIDVDGDQITGDSELAGTTLTTWLRDHGTIVRPYGNSLAFGLALSAQRRDIDELVEALGQALAANSVR